MQVMGPYIPGSSPKNVGLSLSEKCQNTVFFLVRIFPHSDQIRRDAEYLSISNLSLGKYGLEKTPYLHTFRAVYTDQ